MSTDTRRRLKFADATVLQDWFAPMSRALDGVRFSDAQLSALPMGSFILSGCLRQLLDARSLRDFLQTLFHQDASLSLPPFARSTWADALASPTRARVLCEALGGLVTQAQSLLPDRLALVPGLGKRSVIATDATYLAESSHYGAVYPREGGQDNKKGHMVLSHYDVRKGIPLCATTQTQSFGEMRVLKTAAAQEQSCLRTRNAIHVVDRAFIDGTFWDQHLQRYRSTMITRMKSSLLYTLTKENEVLACTSNQGVLFDRQISLNCSKEAWRLIGFRAPDGIDYEYLTNDLGLLAGVVAFLYHRRWDKEKYYDSFKNDLAGTQAWGKSANAIEQQALMGMVTVILTQLFLQRRQQDLERSTPDSTQQAKHKAKQKQHSESSLGIALRASWMHLSKITRQLWRFLRNCFAYAHEPALYRRQLEPLLRGYI